MSAPPSCCDTAPTLLKIWPPMPPMRNFRPWRSCTLLDLATEPAAHLRAGVARGDAVHPLVAPNRRQHLAPAGVVEPGPHLPAVQPEGQRGAEGHRGVLAHVVVGRGVADLDGAGAGGVQHLQRGYDLAGREGADLELAVGQLGHAAADELLVAVERVEALGEAAGAAPVESGLRAGLRRPAQQPGSARPRCAGSGHPGPDGQAPPVAGVQHWCEQPNRAKLSSTSAREAP